jgi:hypothetical protein
MTADSLRVRKSLMRMRIDRPEAGHAHPGCFRWKSDRGSICPLMSNKLSFVSFDW